MTITADSLPGTANPAARSASRLALAGGVTSFLSLGALHVLRPDLDPSWHVISEYAVGPFAWVMALCFASLAVACAALFVALLGNARTVGGRIGLGALLFAALGLAMASLFPIDAITNPPGPVTLSGQLHGVSAMIGNPGLITAALCLAYALRRNPLWAPVRTPMLAFAHLTWIAFALMAGAMIALISSGSTDGLGGLVGWANRLLMLGYFGWVVSTAWPLARR